MAAQQPTFEEIEAAIPEDRKHISGLVDAMEQADIDSHKRGLHEDRVRDDCPLCGEDDE